MLKIISRNWDIVLNPAELSQGMTPGDYMKICFAMIDVADEVYFMPCYADSLVARLELQYCEYINKRTRFQILPIQYAEDIWDLSGENRT